MSRTVKALQGLLAPARLRPGESLDGLGPADSGLRLLFAGVPLTVGSNIFLAGLLVAVLWPMAERWLAVAWFCLLVAIQAGRLVLWSRYRSAGRRATIEAARWLFRFRIGVIGGGALWGAVVAILFPAADFVQQVFMAFVLAGLTAGSVTSLAPDRLSVLGFMLLSLAPLILGFLLQDGVMSQAMSVMLLLFLGFGIVSSERQQKTLFANFMIRSGQDAMREVLSEAAAQLLASRAETLDAAIEDSLRLAGERLGADRAYLFQSSGAGRQMSNTHEWCAPGIAPQKEAMQDLPVEAFPWGWNRVQKGEVILVSDLSRIPSEAAAEKAMLESQDITAICVFPIQQDGVTVGFIGFDQVGGVRAWAELEARLLTLLAGLIGSALLRAEREADLAESFERLNATLGSTRDGILAVDAGGRVLFMNRPFREMWNLPDTLVGGDDRDEDVLAHASAQMVDPEDFMRDGREIYLSADDSQDLIKLVDGRVFERSSRPLGNGTQVRGRVWSFHDMTEWKRAQQALSQRTQELLEAQQLASLGHWTADLVSGELYWSDQIFHIFGRSPDTYKPSVSSFRAAVHPGDQRLLHETEKRAKQTGRLDVVHRIVRPDGGIRVVHELARMELDETGKPHRLTGTVQDITERVETEQKNAATRAQLVLATQTANLGIWEYELTEDRFTWNEQMRVLTGLPADEFEGSYDVWEALLHPEDRPRMAGSISEMRRRAVARQPCDEGQEVTPNGLAVDSLFRIRRHDTGEIRWMRGLGATLVDDERVPCRMVGMILDVSELMHAREAAEKANRAKSEFLSSMSHELRTPLNAVLGFGQLLASDGKLSEAQRGSVQEILDAGNHLLTLISDVLDLARIESGHLDLSLGAVELGPVVEECVALVQLQADRRGIPISCTIGRSVAVRADRQRLKQALLNLLSNAIKYNREGGSVQLQVQPAADGRLRILVRDEGEGIDPARHSELFLPFSRLGAEAGPIEGTGIGLSVTRRLVEAMDGRVDVESERGAGSTFWIELPRDVSGASGAVSADLSTDVSPMAGSPLAVSPVDSASITEKSVLYIDDSMVNLRLVAQIFGHMPELRLLTAHTPGQGMELARRHRPALILLDITMPGMDGYEVLEMLRQDVHLQHTPVIAITAHAMRSDIERGLAAGFADYLTKPLNVRQFLETVRQRLAQ